MSGFMSIIDLANRLREIWWDTCELNLKKKKISNAVESLSSPKFILKFRALILGVGGVLMSGIHVLEKTPRDLLDKAK